MSAVLISVTAGAKVPSSSFNVTVTVYDTDASGARTHIGSDDYNGSGYAVYNYAKDPSTATDVYAGTKMFLDLFGQSTRTLYINADDPLPGSPSGPAPGQYWQNVEFYAGCYDANLNLVPLQNLTTSSGNCRVGIDFNSAGMKYKLDMGPVLPANGPATGWAYIQCNSVAGGQCVSWTVTPNMSGPNPTVANLYSFGKHGLTYLDQYRDTYRISFTNP
jgi:hypothetical protein